MSQACEPAIREHGLPLHYLHVWPHNCENHNQHRDQGLGLDRKGGHGQMALICDKMLYMMVGGQEGIGSSLDVVVCNLLIRKLSRAAPAQFLRQSRTLKRYYLLCKLIQLSMSCSLSPRMLLCLCCVSAGNR